MDLDLDLDLDLGRAGAGAGRGRPLRARGAEAPSRRPMFTPRAGGVPSPRGAVLDVVYTSTFAERGIGLEGDPDAPAPDAHLGRYPDDARLVEEDWEWRRNKALVALSDDNDRLRAEVARLSAGEGALRAALRDELAEEWVEKDRQRAEELARHAEELSGMAASHVEQIELAIRKTEEHWRGKLAVLQREAASSALAAAARAAEEAAEALRVAQAEAVELRRALEDAEERISSGTAAEALARRLELDLVDARKEQARLAEALSAVQGQGAGTLAEFEAKLLSLDAGRAAMAKRAAMSFLGASVDRLMRTVLSFWYKATRDARYDAMVQDAQEAANDHRLASMEVAAHLWFEKTEGGMARLVAGRALRRWLEWTVRSKRLAWLEQHFRGSIASALLRACLSAWSREARDGAAMARVAAKVGERLRPGRAKAICFYTWQGNVRSQREGARRRDARRGVVEGTLSRRFARTVARQAFASLREWAGARAAKRRRLDGLLARRVAAIMVGTKRATFLAWRLEMRRTVRMAGVASMLSGRASRRDLAHAFRFLRRWASDTKSGFAVLAAPEVRRALFRKALKEWERKVALRALRGWATACRNRKLAAASIVDFWVDRTDAGFREKMSLALVRWLCVSRTATKDRAEAEAGECRLSLDAEKARVKAATAEVAVLRVHIKRSAEDEGRLRRLEGSPLLSLGVAQCCVSARGRATFMNFANPGLRWRLTCFRAEMPAPGKENASPSAEGVEAKSRKRAPDPRGGHCLVALYISRIKFPPPPPPTPPPPPVFVEQPKGPRMRRIGGGYRPMTPDPEEGNAQAEGVGVEAAIHPSPRRRSASPPQHRPTSPPRLSDVDRSGVVPALTDMQIAKKRASPYFSSGGRTPRRPARVGGSLRSANGLETKPFGWPGRRGRPTRAPSRLGWDQNADVDPIRLAELGSPPPDFFGEGVDDVGEVSLVSDPDKDTECVVLFFGGQASSSPRDSLGDLWALRLGSGAEAESWQSLSVAHAPQGGVPSPRHDAGMCACARGSLVLFGGYAGREGVALNDLWVLRLEFDEEMNAPKPEWTRIPMEVGALVDGDEDGKDSVAGPWPGPRAHHSLTSFVIPPGGGGVGVGETPTGNGSEFAYLFGGVSPAGEGLLNELWVLRLDSMRWSRPMAWAQDEGQCPTPRRNHAACVVPGYALAPALLRPTYDADGAERPYLVVADHEGAERLLGSKRSALESHSPRPFGADGCLIIHGGFGVAPTCDQAAMRAALAAGAEGEFLLGGSEDEPGDGNDSDEGWEDVDSDAGRESIADDRSDTDAVGDKDAPEVERLAAVAAWGDAPRGSSPHPKVGKQPCGVLRDLYALDVTTLEWRRLDTVGEVPGPLRGHSISVVPPDAEGACRLILTGGYDGLHTRSEVFVLDLSTLAWSRLVSGEGPSARAEHASCVALAPLRVPEPQSGVDPAEGFARPPTAWSPRVIVHGGFHAGAGALDDTLVLEDLSSRERLGLLGAVDAEGIRAKNAELRAIQAAAEVARSRGAAEEALVRAASEQEKAAMERSNANKAVAEAREAEKLAREQREELSALGAQLEALRGQLTQFQAERADAAGKAAVLRAEREAAVAEADQLRASLVAESQRIAAAVAERNREAEAALGRAGHFESLAEETAEGRRKEREAARMEVKMALAEAEVHRQEAEAVASLADKRLQGMQRRLDALGRSLGDDAQQFQRQVRALEEASSAYAANLEEEVRLKERALLRAQQQAADVEGAVRGQLAELLESVRGDSALRADGAKGRITAEDVRLEVDLAGEKIVAELRGAMQSERERSEAAAAAAARMQLELADAVAARKAAEAAAASRAGDPDAASLAERDEGRRKVAQALDDLAVAQAQLAHVVEEARSRADEARARHDEEIGALKARIREVEGEADGLRADLRVREDAYARTVERLKEANHVAEAEVRKMELRLQEQSASRWRTDIMSAGYAEESEDLLAPPEYVPTVVPGVPAPWEARGVSAAAATAAAGEGFYDFVSATSVGSGEFAAPGAGPESDVDE